MGIGRGYLLLVLSAVLAGPVGAQSADELLQRADQYYEEFTWDKAIELYGEFARKYPTDPRVAKADYRALNATFRLEKIENIETALTAFVEKHAGTTWAALGKRLLAEYLRRYRRWDNWERIGTLYAEALRDYRNAVGRRKFSPAELHTYVEMLFEAAEFYRDWGNPRARELAEEHLRSIIAYRLNDDATARAWLFLGDLFRQRDDAKAKAEEAWLMIVRELPRSDSADDALYRLAQLDLEAENYVRARARLMELRKRYPKSELEDDAERQIDEIEEPMLHLQVSETHLPGAKIPTRLVTRNIKGVQFTAWRVDLFDLIAGGAMPRELPSLAKQGRKVFTWRQPVEDRGDYKFSQPKLDSPMREPGVYVIEAVADGLPHLVRHALVNITSLVLVQQYAERKLVSYVASRASLQPVEQVELLLLRPNNGKYTTIAKGSTNADGLLTQIVPQRANDDDRRLMAIGRKGNEVVFQEDGLYTWWNQDAPRLETYLYTDRPVYRPQNTVHYRAILRRSQEGEFRNVPSVPVTVTINDPRGEEVRKETLTTDEFGTIAGELTLSAEPRLGVYHVALQTPDGQSGGGSFRVEEYRKPEFEVSIGRPLAEVRPGGAAAVPVTAKYYFGAPVAEAEVKYVVQRRPYWHFIWWPGPWDWFYAGWREPRHHWGGEQVVAEGTVKTDAQGQAVVEFPTADDNDYTYTIQAEVVDVTRRVVEASDSLTITRKAFFLTARANQGLYAPEDDVSLTIRAENADQQPVETPFTVMLWKMKWVPELVDPKTKEVTKAAHYEREAKVWTEERRLRTDPASGERVVTFKAPSDGYYELAVTAPDTFDPKAEITTEAGFWVASDAWKGVNYNHANLQLVTEKDLYQKGDTARLLVNSPNPDGALLLTIGADAILTTKVVRLIGNSQVIELPILDSYAPNVFINATLVDTKQVYFAQKELMVPPTDRLLNVKIESDREEFKPRTRGTFTITTTDQNGKPVPAQVSLGISDESVYAIQEEMVQPIGAFFYGRKRWNQIRTSVSFEGYGEYDSEAADRVTSERRATVPAAAPAPGAPL
ncbi:MAG: tetratricopeptide repeat protein, partial [Armatimonadetes bacterium]|nr:tetratricopeptide repeat protein [Armatimonadota bacterium]